jgi:Icc-related predicted phosphoesterase
VPFWLCVGDIADAAGRYESLGARVYWIHGNNDNFDAIAAADLPADLIHIPNASVMVVGHGFSRAIRPLHEEASDVGHGFSRAIRVAGLGGTFAPTWYEMAVGDLPHPKKSTAKGTELADKRRHFVREEVEACKRLTAIDVLLTHEAPKPFRAFPGGRPSTGLRAGGPDAGKSQINEVLAAMKPRLHLFGHHHRYTDEVREGVRSVGLDLVSRSYLLIDAASLQIEFHALKY